MTEKESLLCSLHWADEALRDLRAVLVDVGPEGLSEAELGAVRAASVAVRRILAREERG